MKCNGNARLPIPHLMLFISLSFSFRLMSNIWLPFIYFLNSLAHCSHMHHFSASKFLLFVYDKWVCLFTHLSGQNDPEFSVPTFLAQFTSCQTFSILSTEQQSVKDVSLIPNYSCLNFEEVIMIFSTTKIVGFKFKL